MKDQPGEKELKELDAWIGEHVMGFHRMNFDNGHDQFNYLTIQKERADKTRKHGFVEGNRMIDSFPKYTTDAAAAMRVLEKCQRRIPTVLDLDGSSPRIVALRISDLDGLHLIAPSATACTLSLAIARFAKKLYSK